MALASTPKSPSNPMPDEEAYSLFSSAKLKACYEWPYFRTALMSFVPIRDDGYGTAGIDKYGHVYFDPETFKSWGVVASAGILAHECGHWLRLHEKRAEYQGITQEDMYLWNLATDVVINKNLRECEIRLPEDLWYPENLKEKYKVTIPPDSSEEEFFYALKKVPRKVTDSFKGNCSSGAHGVPRPNELTDIGDGKERGMTEVEGNSVRRQVAADILNHAKNKGDFSASLLRWAEDTLACKIRWEQQLRSTVRQSVAFRSGMNTYTYARPSRRQQAVPDAILPSMRRPVPKVGIIIDTSGSMDKTDLSRALSETKGVLKSVGREEGVFVLAVDAEVGFASRVFNTKQVKLTGGGGTDMVAGFKHIAKNKLKPDMVFLFTDGFTPFPAKALPYKVVCVLVGEKATKTAVPPWMKVIRVVD